MSSVFSGIGCSVCCSSNLQFSVFVPLGPLAALISKMHLWRGQMSITTCAALDELVCMFVMCICGRGTVLCSVGLQRTSE